MNRVTKTIVSTIGVILGLSGIDHGIFEILQGNTPTNVGIIQAIGPAQKMWEYGGEEALTIIPNFLVTGLLAILVGIALIVWSVRYVHRVRGPFVLFLLTVLLLLFGGGVAAPVVIYPLAGISATRINKPLNWWRKALPKSLRPTLAKLWPYTLTIGTISFLIGLYIAITGHVPGVSAADPERILAICWSFVFGGGWGLFLLSLLSGFADDIQHNWGNV
jgi:hypothetical protein